MNNQPWKFNSPTPSDFGCSTVSVLLFLILLLVGVIVLKMYGYTVFQGYGGSSYNGPNFP